MVGACRSDRASLLCAGIRDHVTSVDTPGSSATPEARRSSDRPGRTLRSNAAEKRHKNSRNALVNGGDKRCPLTRWPVGSTALDVLHLAAGGRGHSPSAAHRTEDFCWPALGCADGSAVGWRRYPEPSRHRACGLCVLRRLGSEIEVATEDRVLRAALWCGLGAGAVFSPTQPSACNHHAARIFKQPRPMEIMSSRLMLTATLGCVGSVFGNSEATWGWRAFRGLMALSGDGRPSLGEVGIAIVCDPRRGLVTSGWKHAAARSTASSTL